MQTDAERTLTIATTAFTEVPTNDQIQAATDEREYLFTELTEYAAKATELQALIPSGHTVPELTEVVTTAEKALAVLESLNIQLSNPSVSVPLDGTTYTIVTDVVDKVRTLREEVKKNYDTGRAALEKLTQDSIETSRIEGRAFSDTAQRSADGVASSLNEARTLQAYATAIYDASATDQATVHGEIAALLARIDEKKTAVDMATSKAQAASTEASQSTDVTTVEAKRAEAKSHADDARTVEIEATHLLSELRSKVTTLETLVKSALTTMQTTAYTALSRAELLVLLAEDARDLVVADSSLPSFMQTPQVPLSAPEISDVEHAVTAARTAEKDFQTWQGRHYVRLQTSLLNFQKPLEALNRRISLEELTRRRDSVIRHRGYLQAASRNWPTATAQVKSALETVFTLTISDMSATLTQAERNRDDRQKAHAAATEAMAPVTAVRTADRQATAAKQDAETTNLTRFADRQVADATRQADIAHGKISTAENAARDAYVASRRVLIGATTAAAEAEKRKAITRKSAAETARTAAETARAAAQRAADQAKTQRLRPLWVGVGAGGEIVVATNPADSWISTGTIRRTFYDMATDGTTWVAVGPDNTTQAGIIMTTTDPTGPWHYAADTGTTADGKPFVSRNLKGVATDGKGTWVAVGWRGIIVTTTDPAGSWRPANSTTDQILKAVATDGKGLWIAVGTNGVIRVTNDPAGRWDYPFLASLGSKSGSDFYSVATDGTDWVIVGEKGTILTTNNGWFVPVANSNTNTLWGVATDGKGTWMAIGKDGTILTTTGNLLNPWTALPSSLTTGTTHHRLVATDGKGTWAVLSGTYPSTFFVSTDITRTWTKKLLPGRHIALNGMVAPGGVLRPPQP